MPSGPPLLLLAGWTQSRRAWDRFLPWLDGFTVIAVDNRETGTAGPCPDGFTIEEMAADALAAVNDAGHERFAVVGHSMGGMIAQALAFMAPGRVERMVLVSTGPGSSRGIPPEPSAYAIPPGVTLPEDPDDAAVALRAAFYAMYMAPGGDPPREAIAWEEALRAQGTAAGLEGLIRQLEAIRAWDPPGQLKDLGIDIAVVHGDADPLVPYANGQIVADSAGVPLLTLRGIGHMVPWEAPDELAQVICGRQ